MPGRRRRRARHHLLESHPLDGRITGVEHAGAEVAHIDARAEAPAGAGEDHDPDVVFGGERGEGPSQLAHELLVESVEALGPVQSEKHHTVAR